MLELSDFEQKSMAFAYVEFTLNDFKQHVATMQPYQKIFSNDFLKKYNALLTAVKYKESF